MQTFIVCIYLLPNAIVAWMILRPYRKPAQTEDVFCQLGDRP